MTCGTGHLPDFRSRHMPEPRRPLSISVEPEPAVARASGRRRGVDGARVQMTRPVRSGPSVSEPACQSISRSNKTPAGGAVLRPPGRVRGAVCRSRRLRSPGRRSQVRRPAVPSLRRRFAPPFVRSSARQSVRSFVRPPSHPFAQSMTVTSSDCRPHSRAFWWLGKYTSGRLPLIARRRCRAPRRSPSPRGTWG